MLVWLVTGLDSGSGVMCPDAAFTRIFSVDNITSFGKFFKSMTDLGGRGSVVRVGRPIT